MGIPRKNTVVVDFNVLPKRPSPAEVQKFIREQLKLDISTVRNLQMHTIRRQTLIELNSLEAAERLASAHNNKHYLEVEKKKYIVPVFVEDMAINVRVHDLPPDMPNIEVAENMKRYGKVKSVEKEVWKKYFPGTPNGVRIVRIELKKPIPSYIRIGDEMSMVTYKSQIATCLHCGHKVHPKMKCSEATSKKVSTTDAVAVPQPHAEQQQQPSPQQPPFSSRPLPPQRKQCETENNKADNSIGALSDKQHKRGRTADPDKSEMNHMDCTPEASNSNKNEMSHEEWLSYQSNRLDRIIEANKKFIENTAIVLSK